MLNLPRLGHVGLLSSYLISDSSTVYSYIISTGIVVITIAQVYSTKLKPEFCAILNPACSVSEACDSENQWQWSLLDLKLTCSRQSTIHQKPLIIIILDDFSQNGILSHSGILAKNCLAFATNVSIKQTISIVIICLSLMFKFKLNV